jgi:hypothetical protein
VYHAITQIYCVEADGIVVEERGREREERQGVRRLKNISV